LEIQALPAMVTSEVVMQPDALRESSVRWKQAEKHLAF
jgi:hypothetical protein